jgi:hypothetical protein
MSSHKRLGSLSLGQLDEDDDRAALSDREDEKLVDVDEVGPACLPALVGLVCSLFAVLLFASERPDPLLPRSRGVAGRRHGG